MPVGTGTDIKAGVVYEWLAGASRDKIAQIYNISTGGVTNIINEWRIRIGGYIADDLRELALSLKKAKLTPLQCSMGFRVAKIMQRLGITEEQFESFMADIYNRCQRLEVGPDQIENYLKEIIKLSKIVFPSEIPNYLQTQKREVENLQEKNENLQQEISASNIQKTIIERKLNSLIEKSNISREAIAWYTNSKQELENAQISINDISLFSQCLSVLKSQGYDVSKILKKFTEVKKIDDLQDFQQTTIDIHRANLEKLTREENHLHGEINSHRLKISQIKQLESMGLGLKEFKIMYNKINEIANEHNIDYVITVEKFLNDLDNYDDYLTLKDKVESLKQEFSRLNTQITNQRKNIYVQQNIGSALQNLFKMGLSETDVLEINSILPSYGFDYDNINKDILNKQSLIKDLSIYRNIKLVIREYEIKKGELSSRITELENQKANLQYYLNFLIMIVYKFGDLQLLIKKASLEKPQIIFICLLYNSLINEDKNLSEKNDDPNKVQDQNENNDNLDQNNEIDHKEF
jgi:hypothetical protein